MRVILNKLQKVNKKSYLTVFLMICLLIPYNNTINSSIFMFLKISILIILLFIISGESILGLLSSTMALWFIINEYSKNFNPDKFLGYELFRETNPFKLILKYCIVYFPNKYFIIIVTVLIMLWVLIFSNKLLKNSKSRKSKYWFVNKAYSLIYNFRIIVPFIAYIIVVNGVISAFANIYTVYYNDYYLKYALHGFNDKNTNIEELPSDVMERKYIIHHKETKEDGLNDETVTLHYDYSQNPTYYLDKKQIDTKDFQYELKTKYDANFAPSYIDVKIDYKNGKTEYKNYDRSFKISGEKEDSLGTEDYLSIFLYFSRITFFTVGYGDILPNDLVAKELVGLEILTAHILAVIFIPILIIVVQDVLSKKDDSKGTDLHKFLEDITQGYIIKKNITDGHEFKIKNKRFTINITKHEKE